MKKLIALLLVAVFMLSFAACGGGGGANTPEEAVKILLNAEAAADVETFFEISLFYNKPLVMSCSNLSDEEKDALGETMDEVAETLRENAKDMEKSKINFISATTTTDEEINFNLSWEKQNLKEFGLDSAVQNFAQVNISYEVITDSDEYRYEKERRSFICVKISGKWYVAMA